MNNYDGCTIHIKCYDIFFVNLGLSNDLEKGLLDAALGSHINLSETSWIHLQRE